MEQGKIQTKTLCFAWTVTLDIQNAGKTNGKNIVHLSDFKMARQKKLIVESTGTDRGYSRASELVYGCEKRAYLNCYAGLPSQKAPLIGSCGHAMLAEFYLGKLKNQDIDKLILVDGNKEPIDGEVVQKAKNVIFHYMAHYTPTGLGKVLDVEQYIEGTIAGNPATMRLDLAVKALKRDTTRIARMYGVTIEPGIWIVDYKFVANASPLSIERYRMSLQFQWYLSLARKRYGKRLKGVLVKLCTKAKIPTFHLIPVRWRGRLAEYMLEDLVERLCDLWPLDEQNTYRANPERCFDYGSICRFLVSGHCKRISG
jgi:hypothetical protein